MRISFQIFLILFFVFGISDNAWACKKCDLCTHRCGAIAKTPVVEFPVANLTAARKFWCEQSNLPASFKSFIETSLTKLTPEVLQTVAGFPKESVGVHRIQGEFEATVRQKITGERLVFTLDNFQPRDTASGALIDYSPLRARIASQKSLVRFVQAIVVHLYQVVEARRSAGGLTEIQVLIRNIQGTQRNGVATPYDRLLRDRFGFQKIPAATESENYFLTIAISLPVPARD